MEHRNAAHPGLGLRILLGFLMCCAGLGLASRSDASGMYPVEAGEVPELGADEGLLLVTVETEINFEAVYMKLAGAVLGSRVLKDVKAGRHRVLMRLEAGRYGWDRLRVGNWARSNRWSDYRLGEDPESYFDVHAGVINYPGDLIVGSFSANGTRIQSMDHALLAIDWLEANHPALLGKLSLKYTGAAPDPFPAHYQQTRQAKGDHAKLGGKLQGPPEPGDLSLAPETLWQRDQVEALALSPAGDLLAVQRVEKGKLPWGVDLIDLKSGESHRIAQTDIRFDSMQWAGDQTLLLTMNLPERGIIGAFSSPLNRAVHVIRITRGANAGLAFQAWQVPFQGRILDVLENDPDHILFATIGMRNNLLVHRLDISSEKAIAKFNPATMGAINRLDQGEYWWLADGAGELAVALSWREDRFVLSRRNGRKLEDFLTLERGSEFIPMALSDDAKTLYVITDKDRAQRELVAFDIPTRKVTATLFSKPGVDVVAVMTGAAGEAVGVRYYEHGRLVSDYFGAEDRRRVLALQKAFPGKSVVMIDRSRDGRQLILAVESSQSPVKYYHFDNDADRAALVGDAAPWLKDRAFAPTHSIQVKSKDGLSIEAFLTLPEGTQKRPLVVMPHGGPVGVSDRLWFDNDSQFLASLGYAVLRVNFRGSDGFGKAFREAGHRQFGVAIEDDIDAALTKVLADYPIDPARMCTLGFSYGGYSALISTVRWPGRFRCAVSVAGVTDRNLLYTASDLARTADMRKTLVEQWGDPTRDAELFRSTSPAYRHADIQVPVMLVHGSDDVRVDPEHLRRMQRMLELDGRPPVGLLFEGEGHSFVKYANIHAMWRGIAGFLRQHLGSDAKPSAAQAPAAAENPPHPEQAHGKDAERDAGAEGDVDVGLSAEAPAETADQVHDRVEQGQLAPR